MQECASHGWPTHRIRLPPPGISRMTDGLGQRVAATDSATGEPVEHLELATDLVLHTAFASSLADRVARLASVRHASYVRVRRVDRPAIDRLVVVSDATPGRRLSDLLDASEAAGVRPDIDAVVALLRQLLPAVALYSRHNRDQALGTIAPERLFIAPPCPCRHRRCGLRAGHRSPDAVAERSLAPLSRGRAAVGRARRQHAAR